MTSVEQPTLNPQPNPSMSCAWCPSTDVCASRGLLACVLRRSTMPDQGRVWMDPTKPNTPPPPPRLSTGRAWMDPTQPPLRLSTAPLRTSSIPEQRQAVHTNGDGVHELRTRAALWTQARQRHVHAADRVPHRRRLLSLLLQDGVAQLCQVAVERAAKPCSGVVGRGERCRGTWLTKACACICACVEGMPCSRVRMPSRTNMCARTRMHAFMQLTGPMLTQ